MYQYNYINCAVRERLSKGKQNFELEIIRIITFYLPLSLSSSFLSEVKSKLCMLNVSSWQHIIS